MTTSLIRTIKWPVKDPEEYLPFGHKYLEASSDPITASEWTIPAGVTYDNDSYNTDTALIWLKTGINEVDYTIKNKVTLTSGKIIVRRAVLQVRER